MRKWLRKQAHWQLPQGSKPFLSHDGRKKSGEVSCHPRQQLKGSAAVCGCARKLQCGGRWESESVERAAEDSKVSNMGRNVWGTVMIQISV